MRDNIFNSYFNNKLNSNSHDVSNNNLHDVSDNNIHDVSDNNVIILNDLTGQNIISREKKINKNHVKLKQPVKRSYINQLFVIKPSKIFTENLLKLFIPDGFNEYYTFSINSVKEKIILEKLNDIYFKKNFQQYYIKCKYNAIFKNLNIKKAITILRQFLRIYNYKIVIVEKTINSEKIRSYKLININKKKMDIKNNVKKFNKNISFD